MNKGQRIQKRLFDLILSVTGLLFFSPLLFVIIICILIVYGRPVFFMQKRVGLNGKNFDIIKFRTMKINDDDNTITIYSDPRIIPFGRVLRKYKLDELPTMLNVLFGEMSIVGPRPDVPGFADKLKGKEGKILTVKPGITSPATLKYRNEEKLLDTVVNPHKYNSEIIFPDKVRLNLIYIENWTIWLDMKIIFSTLIPIGKNNKLT